MRLRCGEDLLSWALRWKKKAAGLSGGLPFALALAVWVLGEPPVAFSQEKEVSSDEVTVTKTSDRLHFKVPPDWPIEKRDGITAPIPVEEYLARKFKLIEGSIQALEQRVNGLDLRVRVLEEDLKRKNQGLRSSERPASAAERENEGVP